jgi:enamine deaminase RidA (YjgF/YER057c/UK114 family)
MAQSLDLGGPTAQRSRHDRQALHTAHPAQARRLLPGLRGDLGKLILIAGQVPHDVNDKMVGEGSFEAQVEQVFKNLDAALKAAGRQHEEPGEDHELLRRLGDVRGAHGLPHGSRPLCRYANPPTSTFIYVVRLAQPNWLFEMDAMAVIDG